jgi:hypothetical protein
MQQLRVMIAKEQHRINERIQVVSSLQTRYVVSLLCKWAKEPWIPFTFETNAQDHGSSSGHDLADLVSIRAFYPSFYSSISNSNNNNNSSSGSSSSDEGMMGGIFGKSSSKKSNEMFETPIVSARELLYRYKLEVFAGMKAEEMISILKSLHKLGKCLLVYKKKDKHGVAVDQKSSSLNNNNNNNNNNNSYGNHEEDDCESINSMYIILDEIWFMRCIINPISMINLPPLGLKRAYSIISTLAIGTPQPRVYSTIGRMVLDILLILNYAVIVDDKCLFILGFKMDNRPVLNKVLANQNEPIQQNDQAQAEQDQDQVNDDSNIPSGSGDGAAEQEGEGGGGVTTDGEESDETSLKKKYESRLRKTRARAFLKRLEVRNEERKEHTYISIDSPPLIILRFCLWIFLFIITLLCIAIPIDPTQLII